MSVKQPDCAKTNQRFYQTDSFFTLDTQKNKADIRHLQEQMQEVLEKFRQINFNARRDRENTAYE